MSDINAAYPAACRRHRKHRGHELREVPMPRDDEPREVRATDQAIRATPGVSDGR